MATFGVDLWDRFNVVQKHGDDVLENCRLMSTFIHKRASIEKEYGKQMIALAKEELSSAAKGFFQGLPAAAREKGSLQRGWASLSEATEQIGKAHLDFAIKIKEDIVNPLNNYVLEREKLKKQHTLSGQKILKDFQEVVQRMEKAEQKLEKTKKDLESIEAEADKAGASKASKYQPKVQQAQEKVKLSEDELQQARNATEDSRQRTFLNDLPVVLNDFQKMEEERISYLTQLFDQFNTHQETLIPATTDSCNSSKGMVTSISVADDIALFIAENKSNQGPFVGGAGKSGPDRRTKTRTVKYTSEFRMPEFESFESLPTEERRERVQSKIEEIRASIKVEQRATKGIENMMLLYSSQPEMKAKVEQQLEVSQTKLTILKEHQTKYKGILATLGDASATISEENEDAQLGVTYAEDEQLEQACTLIAVDPFEAIALYDYEAGEEDEITFQAGDTIIIHAQGDSGWWEGEINGKIGLLPSNYVEMK
eukprot:TRINITY_DN2252_c0_g1_i1.p1 TRINITY_DN2252_c0_g1~~TRINITY_DN2252_c0_g1_i1.p1  ORF type:complete len:483 (-),score=137.11 TRINITY_DN2252_c0_g1_i1:287-1735(-)